MVIASAGTPGNPHAEHCWATQRVYAERIGASHRVLELASGKEGLRTSFEFLASLPQETRCLLLEWDVEVMLSAPSIFEELPGNGFYMRPEYHQYGFFNLGVMLGTASDFARLAKILPPLHGGSNRWEFLLCNSILKNGFEVKKLEWEWNAVRREGHFVHHAGCNYACDE